VEVDAGHSAGCRHRDGVGHLHQDGRGHLHRDGRGRHHRDAVCNHLDAVRLTGHRLRPDEQTLGVAESACHWATVGGPEAEVQPCRLVKAVARERQSNQLSRVRRQELHSPASRADGHQLLGARSK
jgi:hypothetical protein